IPIPCDLKEEDQDDDAFRRMEADGGPVRALAHCAASVRYEPSRELVFDSFSAVVGTTLFTGFNTINRWTRTLLDQELDGLAVALTSPAPHEGQPGIAHSAAGKSGLEGFINSIVREYKPNGIRINVVGPGIFPVEKSKEMWDRLQSEADAAGEYRDRYG